MKKTPLLPHMIEVDINQHQQQSNKELSSSPTVFIANRLHRDESKLALQTLKNSNSFSKFSSSSSDELNPTYNLSQKQQEEPSLWNKSSISANTAASRATGEINHLLLCSLLRRRGSASAAEDVAYQQFHHNEKQQLIKKMLERLTELLLKWHLSKVIKKWRDTAQYWSYFIERKLKFQGESGARRLKVLSIKILLLTYQHYFSLWRNRTETVVKRERDNACRAIQRAYSFYRGYQLFHDYTKEIKLELFGEVVGVSFIRSGTLVCFYNELQKEKGRMIYASSYIQSVYRRNAVKNQYDLLIKALIRLQTFVRSMTLRARYKGIFLKVIKLQAHIKKLICRRWFRSVIEEVIKIQCTFRMLRIRHHWYAILRAVQLICRVFRKYNVRRKARQKRGNELRAALTLQRFWYHKNNQLSTFILLGCLREIEKREQAIKYTVNKRFRHAKAKTIQRYYQKWLGDAKLNASIVIQKSVRRYLAKCFRVRLVEGARIRLLQDDSSRKIAFCWMWLKRGRICRRIRLVLEETELQRMRLHNLRQSEAAVSLQSHIRSFICRTRMTQLRSRQKFRNFVLHYLEMRFAAKRLDVVNHRTASNFISLIFDATKERVLWDIGSSFHKSACKIQKTFKSYYCRRMVAASVLVQNSAARRIQVLFRSFKLMLNTKLKVLHLCRSRRNPFVTCNDVSSLVSNCMEKIHSLYHPFDIRCGMSLDEFMHRIGAYHDVLPILKRHGLVSTAQLYQLSASDLMKYGLTEEQGITDARELRNLIADCLSQSIPLTRGGNHCTLSDKVLNEIESFEYVPLDDIEEIFLEEFSSAFSGQNFISRARNILNGLMKGEKYLTRLQLRRYFRSCKTSLEAKQMVQKKLQDPIRSGVLLRRNELKDRAIDMLLFANERLYGMCCLGETFDIIEDALKTLIKGKHSKLKRDATFERMYTHLEDISLKDACSLKIQSAVRVFFCKKVAKGRRHESFSERVRNDYLKERQKNKVRITWNKLRKEEREHILLAQIEAELSSVLKFGWKVSENEVSVDHEERSYVFISSIDGSRRTDTPMYSKIEYQHICVLQRFSRGFLTRRSLQIIRRKQLIESKKNADRVRWEFFQKGMFRFYSLRLNTSPISGKDYIRISLKFVNPSMPFGLSMVQGVNGGAFSSKHCSNNDRIIPIHESLSYTFEEYWSSKLIQSIWRGFRTRFIVSQQMNKESITTILRRGINKASDYAWYGYKLEGISLEMLLNCLGIGSVYGNISRKLMKDKNVLLKGHNFWKKQYEIQEFFRLSSDKDGLIQMGLSSFEATRIHNLKMTQSLKFINSYTNEWDTRSINNCISCEEAKGILLKLVKNGYPNNNSRASRIVEEIQKSNFPITEYQIIFFLNKYKGRPALAQEHVVHDLVDICTTSKAIHVLEAYYTLKKAVERVVIILNHLGVYSLAEITSGALSDAEKIVSMEVREEVGYQTGHAAKGAIVLRKAIDHIFLFCDSAIILQSVLRGLSIRKKLSRLQKQIAQSVSLIQRNARVLVAKKVAQFLSAQRKSPIEQVLDSETNTFYWFNKHSKKASWEEPGEPYRPLIRSKETGLLIRAWPLDDLLQDADEINSEKCSVCLENIATRRCTNCFTSNNSLATFCSICFVLSHQSHDKRHHEADVISEKTASLTCVLCNSYSSRKCAGFRIHPHMINELKAGIQMQKISKRPTREMFIRTIISEIKFPISRSLANAFYEDYKNVDQLRCAQTKTIWDEFMIFLVRMGSECSDHYCAACYEESHARGNRSRHFWVGYRENTPVCVECKNLPATLECLDCKDRFCSSCWSIVHKSNRMSFHSKQILREELLYEAEVYCSICEIREGTDECPLCSTFFCNSCLLFSHSPVCSNRIPDKCSVCKTRQPVLLCQDCGDVYCNEKWMGFAGCFREMHSKGKRLQHRVIPFKHCQKRAEEECPSPSHLQDSVLSVQKELDNHFDTQIRSKREKKKSRMMKEVWTELNAKQNDMRKEQESHQRKKTSFFRNILSIVTSGFPQIIIGTPTRK